MFRVAACLTQEHNLGLLLVAASVCVLSAFIAFVMLSRADDASVGRRQLVWIALGAVVTGNGIWSTHYVSMLAYDVGIPTSFALFESVLSALLVQLACLSSFFLIVRHQSIGVRLSAGALMGGGIAAMHYIGMRGLIVNAITEWDRSFVVWSVIAGIVLSSLAVGSYHALRHGNWRFVAPPIILVAAICGLHFTGMAALTLIPISPDNALSQGFSHELMAIFIAVVAVLLVLVIIVGVFLDRYLVDRARYSASLEDMVEKLRASEQEAHAASNAKSEFVANISHEVRTPMNGVLGMLRLLQDSELSHGQRKQVDTAIGSAKSLLAIINDILDISKLEAGKLELEEASFSAHQVIDEVVSLMSAKAAEKALSLSASVEPNVPEWLEADAGRVRQILFNLVGNAIKFTNAGSVTVNAAYRSNESELVVQVCDTGIGISSEDEAKLFDRFAQADGSIARQTGGAGLGLAISQQLANMMGGRIDLESELGNGSTFTLRINCSVARQPSIISPIQSLGDRASRPMKILIVDDNHVNQYFVSTLLEKLGHICEVAGDGFEAIEAWNERAFDVILMDIQMPELDGITATRRIRESGHPRALIPIIALTANAMAGDREKYLAAGMTDYVRKPIDPEALIAVLNRIANSPDDATAAPVMQPGADKEFTAFPLFDEARLASLRALFGETESQVMIDTTLDGAVAMLDEIKSALQSNDLNSARRTAHSLKGMASNWAADRISAIAQMLERDVTSLDQAEALAVHLDDALEATRALSAA